MQPRRKAAAKSRSAVTNYIRLLRLPPQIQAAIRDESLSMGHARALIAIDDIGRQLAIFREIIARNLNVRETEQLVREFHGRPSSHRQKKSNSGSVEIQRIENALSSHFGSKIKLQQNKKGKGKIVIPFDNDDDLNRLLELLNF